MAMRKIKLNKKHKRENSSKWIQRHLNDEYVLKSKAEGYRSRSSYKLLEIEKRFKFFTKSKNILDLGCAPGGWLQVAKLLTPNDSLIVGIDKLEIDQIKDVKFIHSDFEQSIKNVKHGVIEKRSHFLDTTGQSYTLGFYYIFETNDAVVVECYDWSKKFTNEKGWIDKLSIALDTEEFLDWINQKGQIN